MEFKQKEILKKIRGRKLQANNKPYQINYDDFCRGDEEAPSDKPQAPSVKLQADKKNPE